MVKGAKKGLGLKSLTKGPSFADFRMRAGDGGIQDLLLGTDAYGFGTLFKRDLPPALQGSRQYTGHFPTDARRVLEFLAEWAGVPAPRPRLSLGEPKAPKAPKAPTVDPNAGHTADPNAVREPAHITPLYGHTSQATAYVQDDYPYSRSKRCVRRVWVEYKPGKGYRFMAQTINPDTGRLNNPKASTYSSLGGVMVLNTTNDHVTMWALDINSPPGAFRKFAAAFPDMSPDQLASMKFAAKRQVDLYSRFMAANEMGRSGWAINGIPQPAKPGELERNTKERDEWQQVLAGLDALGA